MKDWTLKAAEEILAKHAKDEAAIAAIIAKHHARVIRPEPGHLQDWAARAGAYLHAEGVRLSSHRIASVVAHFAEPITRLLQEARREHEYNDDQTLCCALVRIRPQADAPCTCGADAFNARIDEVLK
jgi:hypothetical protein